MLRYQAVQYRELGRLAEAADRLTAARAVFADIGDRSGEADALEVLASVHAARGEGDAAEAAYRTALDLLAEFRADYSTASVHRGLGRVLLDRARSSGADLGPALHHLGRAAALYRSRDAPFALGLALTDLGDAHEAAGDPDRATDMWRSALAIMTTRNPDLAARLTERIGRVSRTAPG